MKKEIIVGLIAILIIASVAMATTQDGEEVVTVSEDLLQNISIKINVTASTWREDEKPYDIYNATKKNIEKVGFKVVPEENNVYDAILFVDYKEKIGSPYTRSNSPYPNPFGETVGYGTNIICNLKLYTMKRNLIFEKEISASPVSRTGYFSQLHYSSVKNFEKKVYFKFLGDIIATKYGVGNETSILISALIDPQQKTRKDAVKILDNLDWEPNNDIEKSYYLIAKDEWDELVQIGAPAVEPLIQVSGDDNVRSEVAESLGKIGEPAIEPLIQALKCNNIRVRWGAAEVLGILSWEPENDMDKIYYLILSNGRVVQIGKPAVEPLIQMLKDDDDWVRRKAAIALGRIGDGRAVEPLIQALKDDDDWVRIEAVIALGDIGDERAVEPLIQALKDDEGDVRRKAAIALGKIGDERAVEPLIQALEDDDNWVRNKAAEVLATFGWEPKNDIEKSYYLIAKDEWDELVQIGEPAVEPLIQVLKYDERHSCFRADDYLVRRDVVFTLGRIGDERAVEPLIQALKDDDRLVRTRAVWALKGMGDERAVEPLIQALKYDDSNVRGTAAIALGDIGDERAVEPLIQALKDDDNRVRRKAAIALGRIGDERAVEPLTQALKDDDNWVREAAKKALAKIEGVPIRSVFIVIFAISGLLAMLYLLTKMK